MTTTNLGDDPGSPEVIEEDEPYDESQEVFYVFYTKIVIM